MVLKKRPFPSSRRYENIPFIQKIVIQATRTKNRYQDTMKYQHDQVNPATDEEVNLNTDGDNEDSKVADGPGDETIVILEAEYEPGYESLTMVRA
jgi:hypothetical protein